jgi:hypothetical protein
LRFVEPADEQKVGDLLDHFEWIGDATRPKGIPYGIDLAAQFTR